MVQLLENAQPDNPQHIELLERTFIAPLRVSLLRNGMQQFLNVVLAGTQYKFRAIQQYG